MLTRAPALPKSVGTPPADLAPSAARLAGDGLHLVQGRDSAAIHLLLLGDARPGQPLAALVPLDDGAPDRLEALTRLIRGINYPPAPPDTRLTEQRRRRLQHMLQAVDGRSEGASYREIAEVMFGRIKPELWRTSPARDATIRLVRDGRRMIDGGYRQLLHHRRRS